MIVTMGRVLMGGVCERFPDLKFIFLEAGGGWVPSILERMDEQVESFPLEKRWLSMLPSEYFKRQCYVSFEPEEWNIAQCAEFLGSDRLIWASDYPHPEYHPGLVKEVVERVGAAARGGPGQHSRPECLDRVQPRPVTPHLRTPARPRAHARRTARAARRRR